MSQNKKNLFQRKPITIEAIQLSVSNLKEIENFLGNGFEFVTGTTVGDDDISIDLDTLTGPVTAKNGDWLIRGPTGEVYPCPDEIFKLTYDVVDQK